MIIRGNTVGTNMSVDRIADKIGGKEGMRVVLNMGDMTANYNYREIADHVAAGGTVYLEAELQLIPLSHLAEEKRIAYFNAFHADEYYSPCTMNQYWVDDNYNVDSEHSILASASDIGDISSALDELHTYAQSLCGVIVMPPPTPELTPPLDGGSVPGEIPDGGDTE